MEGGVHKGLAWILAKKLELVAKLTRPFRINYDVLVAHNAATWRSLTRYIGETHPAFQAKADSILGFDSVKFAGPAQVGRPGTVIGRIFCAVSLPLCPILLFPAATGLASVANWAIKHWPWIGEMMDGEFRRRQRHHNKAVKKTQTREALGVARAEVAFEARSSVVPFEPPAAASAVPSVSTDAPRPRLVRPVAAPARQRVLAAAAPDRGLE